MCTLATYLALRPIIAFPPELANTIPWRRKLHNILSHPITEAVTLVTLTAEMIHREVAANILRLLGMTGLFDEVTVSDGSLMALWGCVVGVSGVLGYAIYKVVQAPSLGFVRKAVEKKWKKGV
ncbi:hypothetical protein BC829DRAFT_92602 [Chytridium lagenaria]|nr:hypothetical protein BC829DRAFT_92602 [Chytridium lagenaria]